MSLRETIKNEIDKLPEKLLAEVYDFIQYLEGKRDRGHLLKSCQELSSASFKKVWDNEEDSAYDNL
ncbi:MAG: DUF2281 domain-containing protein [Candidatus Abyssobacteria bacterium SURF_5]|uniref:DUF2281 domain-containing protein n=1 Tax=Abyssobacteria bacterium (strain SURF_5) TaxID=2093360 RepID=A0A3A4NDC4_ABYX5|nr:MAG: DUF2281 domain-containing protein [Candidatus Abyssubacteria bacterium SURF_5]